VKVKVFRSVYCDELRKKLSLHSIRAERVVIKTFGQEKAIAKEIDVVQFKVKNKIGPGFVVVEALSVPFICSPLNDQNIKDAVTRYDHLHGLEPADFSEGS